MFLVCPGGLGGTPRGVWGPRLADSRDLGPSGPVRGATLPIFLENRPKHTWGAPGWQNPGTRGLLGRSEGRPCQTHQNTHFWHFWGVGGFFSGGSGAPGWQNPGTRGLLRRSEGATPPMFPKTGQNKHFWQFWGSGGYPQGVWGPRLADSRDPKPPGPVRGGDPAKFPALGFLGGPALKPEKSFFAGFRATLTGCERRSVCWEPLLLVERPAQAARTHNPTIIHFSSVFAVTRTFCAECEGKQRARKPPLEGGWEGEP